MSLSTVLESFPPELQPAIARLAETLREEFGIPRTDFDDLKGIVRELAEAQKRTELRIEELTEAQKRTDQRLDMLTQAQVELAEAQKRTELHLEELTTAQKRTELHLEELTAAQKRTHTTMEERFDKVQRRMDASIGGLGARWGLQTEEAFRQGMRTVLMDVGFTTDRFWEMDTEGEVFGGPEQIELDVIIKNGKLIVIEIKSSLDKGSVYQFARKVQFYARKTGRQVDRKLIVSPYADTRAQEVATQLGVEVCTDVSGLR